MAMLDWLGQTDAEHSARHRKHRCIYLPLGRLACRYAPDGALIMLCRKGKRMSQPTPSAMPDQDLAERYAARFFKFGKYIHHPEVRNEMAAIRAEIFNRITSSRDYTAMLELDERLTGRLLDERAILPVTARVFLHMQNAGTIGAADEYLVSLFVRHYPTNSTQSAGLNNSASILAATSLAPLPTIYQECHNRVLAVGNTMNSWWSLFMWYLQLNMGQSALDQMADLMKPPKAAISVTLPPFTFGGMQ